ncbi:hypothetical protein MKW98_013569 [Papaver atlanticum]|uniref:Uncharacterized protein n=1 Tax=Papaver atlanticum TaxID=357466 RepID=A0AAD4T389_9MAGN|nr:hypothetical protein MKW98_013569 [Papaver atlanticum]
MVKLIAAFLFCASDGGKKILHKKQLFLDYMIILFLYGHGRLCEGGSLVTNQHDYSSQKSVYCMFEENLEAYEPTSTRKKAKELYCKVSFVLP